MRRGAILLVVASVGILNVGILNVGILNVGILGVRPAWAGCSNACSATAEAITVTPPLDCASVQSLPQTCDCALLVTVQNGCTGSILATGFTWTSCQTAAGTGAAGCAALPPGGRGSLLLKVSTLGRTAWSLDLQGDDGSHTVDSALQVSSFDHGGCTIASTSRSPGWIWIAMLVAGPALRRTARQRRQR